MRFGKKEIFLFLTSIFLTLIVFEIGARVWLRHFATQEEFQKYALYTEVPSQKWMFSSHPYLNYYLTPNYKSGLTYHNSFGYRNREFTIKKPADEYRIVVLGGSTIYTTGVADNDKTFPSQLETILINGYGYKNVKVINAGIPGYSTWESLINLEFRVLDIEPDLIIVYPCVNDVTQRMVIPSQYRGDNTGSRKQWSLPPIKLFEYSCFLRIMSRRLGYTTQVGIGHDLVNVHAKMPVTVMYNPPIYFERNLRNMITISKEHDIEIMFATFAFSDAFVATKHYSTTEIYKTEYGRQKHLVINIAKKHNIPIFDFDSVMSKDKENWVDAVHVNEKGALLKARLFADFIHKEGVMK